MDKVIKKYHYVPAGNTETGAACIHIVNVLYPVKTI
jgi:hypothetical protein